VGRADDAGIGEQQRLDPIRVLVVDDHPAIAAAIGSAIEHEDAGAGQDERRPIRIAGVARTVVNAVGLIAAPGSEAPQIVLCDVQLQAGTDGLEVIDAARAAGIRSIVLTSFDRSSLMRAAFERGAAGYLHKGSEMVDVLRAIRRVADGGTAFSAASLDAARYAPRAPSEREIGVLRELNRGATSDEIGARLGISGRTVESHLRRLFDRYGVVSRTELAVLAVREGWIEA
jgi:two-component system response regulator DevR